MANIVVIAGSVQAVSLLANGAEVNTVTVLAASGSSVSVNAVYVSPVSIASPSNVIFNTSVPGNLGPRGTQGATGAAGSATGATGPTGSTGAAGAAGIDGAAGAAGVDGSNGADGSAGSSGQSAHQIWQNAGNTGTQADFLTDLKGADGVAGAAGATGPSERLSDDITVYLPNSSGEYTFGKFQHGDSINATGASGYKSALDLIKEALIELGTLGSAALTGSPSSVAYDTTSTSYSITLTCSCTNVNVSQGSTLTFLFQESTGSSAGSGGWTTLQTYAGVSGNSQAHTLTISFPVLPVSSNWRHFRCVVTESQTAEVKTSSSKSYTPAYTAPTISSTNLDRVAANIDGQFESDSSRCIFHGESDFECTITRESSLVPLDKYSVFKNGSSTAAYGPIDISGSSTVSVNQNFDDGYVGIGVTNTYEIKVWDDKTPYVDSSSTPAKTASDSYTVERYPVKMAASTSALDHTSAVADFQTVYDTVTSAGSSSDSQWIAETTNNSAGSDTTPDLNLTLECTTAYTTGAYIYFFVPAVYFGWSGGTGGDVITGTANAYIDLTDSDNNSYVLKNSDGTGFTGSADFLVLSYSAGLYPENGDASNTLEYIVLRLRVSLGSSQNGLEFTIDNTE